MANPKSATVMGIGAAPIGFVKGKLTLEQAEQLAATFKPSWELDHVAQAPVAAFTPSFSPDATLTDADMRALDAHTHESNGQDVAATNGYGQPHAPPPRASVASEPEDSVIIDRSITADALAKNGAGPVVAPVAQHEPARAVVAPAPLFAPPSPVAPARAVAAPAVAARPQVARVARAAVIDDDFVAPRKSKAGLFIGLGIGAVALIGVAVAVTMSGGTKDEAAAPAATTATATQTEKSIPPPPAMTTAAAATTPTTTSNAVATAAPTQTHAAKPDVAPAPKPQRPSGGGNYPAPQPPAAAKPAPKSGGNIVRDVPF
jgi:hypothetical protein